MNSRGGDGFEIIYSLRNSDALSRKITSEIEKTGQNVRKYYQRRLPSNPSKDYYYILRDTPNNESVLVEYGFLDSNGDDVSQLKNNWEQMAEAVVKAITEYIGVPYTPAYDNNDYYKVQSGDRIFMGNNEVYKESLKEILLKCKIIFYLSAIIALKMFTYYYRNDIIVV